MVTKAKARSFRYVAYFVIGVAWWYAYYATLGIRDLHRNISLFEDMPHNLLFFLTLGDFLYVHFGLKSQSWWKSILTSAGYTAIAVGLCRLPIILIHPKLPDFFDWNSDFYLALPGTDGEILVAGCIMIFCLLRLERWQQNATVTSSTGTA